MNLLQRALSAQNCLQLDEVKSSVLQSHQAHFSSPLNHIWLGAAVLDTGERALFYHHRKFYWIALFWTFLTCAFISEVLSCLMLINNYEHVTSK